MYASSGLDALKSIQAWPGRFSGLDFDFFNLIAQLFSTEPHGIFRMEEGGDETLLLRVVPESNRRGGCERCCSLVTPGIVVGSVVYGLGVFSVGVAVFPWPSPFWWLALRVLLTLLVVALAVLTLWSLGKTVFTSPGSPPPTKEWIHLPAYRGRPLEEPSSTNDSTAAAASRRVSMRSIRQEWQVRFCRHCQNYKPDRTHHCRVTHQCVLRFDHYCPWVSQPVGWRNHKYFFLFCFWCCVLCFIALLGLLGALTMRGWDFDAWGAIELQMGVVSFICFLFTLTLVGFAGMHGWLLGRNQTTLEQMKKDRRWDLGTVALNWHEMFGANKASWFLPIAAPDVGLGLEFGLGDDGGGEDNDLV